MITLDARDLSAMRNQAAVGSVDQATVEEFVGLARKAPCEKQIKIADTLIGRVRAGRPMQHNGQPMTLATMATIVVNLA